MESKKKRSSFLCRIERDDKSAVNDVQENLTCKEWITTQSSHQIKIRISIIIDIWKKWKFEWQMSYF